MSETLLDRARANYKMAEKNFKFINEDDVYLNLTGYLLQQAAELGAKHLLEMRGYRYPRVHDIRALLDDIGCDDTRVENLLNMSDTITSWESKTRYIKDFRLSKRQLESGFVVVKEFLDYVGESTKVDIGNALLEYIDESELDDFYRSIPSSIEVNADNVELLTSMYKTMRRK